MFFRYFKKTNQVAKTLKKRFGSSKVIGSYKLCFPWPFSHVKRFVYTFKFLELLQFISI